MMELHLVPHRQPLVDRAGPYTTCVALVLLLGALSPGCYLAHTGEGGAHAGDDGGARLGPDPCAAYTAAEDCCSTGGCGWMDVHEVCVSRDRACTPYPRGACVRGSCEDRRHYPTGAPFCGGGISGGITTFGICR